jgi:hypothetical protein
LILNCSDYVSFVSGSSFLLFFMVDNLKSSHVGPKVKNNFLMQVEYCPIDKMIVDYMTKALVGSNFLSFSNFIMNGG